MRKAAAELMARDRLGRDVFARGAPEAVTLKRRTVWTATLSELLAAYGRVHTRAAYEPLHLDRGPVFTLEQALDRLAQMVGEIPGLACPGGVPARRLAPRARPAPHGDGEHLCGDARAGAARAHRDRPDRDLRPDPRPGPRRRGRLTVAEDDAPSGAGDTALPAGAMPALFDAPPLAEQERMVEAILFASAEPLRVPAIAARLPQGSDARAALEALEKRYRGRGVRVVQVGEAWAFRTAPDLGFLMRREAEDEKKLSRAAIETLAIIAYHQPVTRAEIEEIRGVAASKGTLDLLLELGWIRLGPRRETPGRPVTFATTEGFLDHFGLASPRDLPGLKELREAGLLEADPALAEAAEAREFRDADETEDLFEPSPPEPDPG